jgi:hypothetical protein
MKINIISGMRLFVKILTKSTGEAYNAKNYRKSSTIYNIRKNQPFHSNTNIKKVFSKRCCFRSAESKKNWSISQKSEIVQDDNHGLTL